MPSPKLLAQYIYDRENLERIDSDYRKYKIYNGKLRDQIREAISKEFLLPETVKELNKRIIPVNITQKIINKLAQVFRSAPNRSDANDNIDNTESMQILAEVMRMNQVGKTVNRYFKLNKNCIYEPYLDKDGVPKLRSIPSYGYTQYSDDEREPSKPTHTIKHVEMEGWNKKNHRHIVWADDEHYTMDGEGNVLDNPGNPYGVNPLIYVKEGEILTPIPDDDLYFLQIAICLLLTDLAFASKYQAWSVIYIIGAEAQKLSFNPNSVITLPKAKDGTDPSIGTIKPTLDTDALLSQVEALIGLLLSTKSLSSSGTSMKLEGGAAAVSGVSKMLDQIETNEDQEDQKQYFIDAEKELWSKLAKNIMPVWINSGEIQIEYAVRFSEDFEPKIVFEDPQPKVSRKEEIETEKLARDAGFSTLKDSLKRLYPDLSDEEIEGMIVDLNQEEIDRRLGGTQTPDQRNEPDQQNV